MKLLITLPLLGLDHSFELPLLSMSSYEGCNAT